MEKKTQSEKFGFLYLFNFKDTLAAGRASMLISSILSGILANLSGGVFYTAFLIGNNIDLVNVGILTIMPLIASAFSVFAPIILERFSKRKYFLAAMRIVYYTVNILGITLLPYFAHGKTQRVIGFAIIVFTANVINALTSGGYPIWHLNFIPSQVRADYFATQQRITVLFTASFGILCALLADFLKTTKYAMTILIIFRIVAFVIAIADVLILMVPKEFEYKKTSEKVRLKEIFSLPLKNGKYAATMLVISIWTFTSSIPSSCWNFYLINDVHVPYTFINAIDSSYCLFLLVFSAFWVKRLKKWSWLKTFAIGAMLHMPTTILYAFTNRSNFVFIMLTVRLTQHFLGVGANLAYANMAYINLPGTNQTVYMAFHSLVVAISGFISTSSATYFISKTADFTLATPFGSLGNVQFLILVQGVLQLAVGLFVLIRRDKLSPSPDNY